MVNPAENITKKQKIGERASTKSNHVDKEENDIGKRSINKKTEEMRLEENRQRSRDIRKSKKIMIENMRAQLVCQSTEIKTLRIENQMQKKELSLLRKAVQLSIANNGSLTRTSVPPTRLSNSEIPNSISGVGSNYDQISDHLIASRQLGNTGSANNYFSDHLTAQRKLGNIGSTNKQFSNNLTAPRHLGTIGSIDNRFSAPFTQPTYSENAGGIDNYLSRILTVPRYLGNVDSSIASRYSNEVPSSMTDLEYQALQRHAYRFDNK